MSRLQDLKFRGADFVVVPIKLLFFAFCLFDENRYFRFRSFLQKITSFLKIYEADEMNQVASWVNPGDCVVDIGANFGIWSEFLLKCVGPSGRVYAFEPNPILVPYLRKKLNYRKSFSLESKGLGQQTSILKLYIPYFFRVLPEPALASAIQYSTYCKTIDILVTTLDEFFSDQEIQFIKIDVEGLEFEVLRGGERLIQRCRPVILCEIIMSMESQRSLDHFLNKNHYVVKKIDNRRCNYLLLPIEKSNVS